MRKEIEQIKNLTLVCVRDLNEVYKAIDENARTLIESVVAERQSPLFRKLEEIAADYAEKIDNKIRSITKNEKSSAELENTFKSSARIKAADIDLDMLNVIKTLEPAAEELSEICKDYENNQTMLRLIREYSKNNKIHNVEIPAIMADRVVALNKMCKDLKDCARIAADYSSPLRAKQLEYIANNFDNAFAAQLKIID